MPISDPEGNGRQNVLVGTAWGGRTAYNIDTLAGDVIWRFDTYAAGFDGWIYSLAELNDITGDGVPEVAFGTGSNGNSLFLVDGASSGGAQDTNSSIVVHVLDGAAGFGLFADGFESGDSSAWSSSFP